MVIDTLEIKGCWGFLWQRDIMAIAVVLLHNFSLVIVLNVSTSNPNDRPMVTSIKIRYLLFAYYLVNITLLTIILLYSVKRNFEKNNGTPFNNLNDTDIYNN